MSKKTGGKESKRKVSFAFHAPQAREVAVVGDFNQWRTDAHLMKKDPDGFWRKSLFVLPGTYEYKFQVDGEWENDPDNSSLCENRFGTRNNCIVVERKE